MGDDTAAHPVWSSDNEALKQEFRRVEAERDHWQILHRSVDSQAERFQLALEEIASRNEGRCSEIASEALRAEDVPNV